MNEFEKELLEALQPLVDGYRALKKDLEELKRTPGPKGEDGISPSPADIVQELLDKHAEKLRGAPGEPGQPGLPGADGKNGADADLGALARILKDDPGFIGRVTGPQGLRGEPGEPGQAGEPGAPGEKGADADPEAVASHLKADPSFIQSVRGEPGQEGPPGKDSPPIDPKVIASTLKGDEAFVESIRGLPGEPGQPGLPGHDGAGIEVKTWEPGIYREGFIVQHNAGQYFKAAKDTNDEPGKGDGWTRLGNAGFRWCGLKKEDNGYEEGDIFIDDGTTFYFHNGRGRMLAKRGKDGLPGTDGKDGKDGRDAPTPIEALMDEEKATLSIVWSDGAIMDIDFSATREFAAKAAEVLLKEKGQAYLDSVTAPREGGMRIKAFHGAWQSGEPYFDGEMVAFGTGLWLAKGKIEGTDIFDGSSWEKIYDVPRPPGLSKLEARIRKLEGLIKERGHGDHQ